MNYRIIRGESQESAWTHEKSFLWPIRGHRRAAFQPPDSSRHREVAMMSTVTLQNFCYLSPDVKPIMPLTASAAELSYIINVLQGIVIFSYFILQMVHE